MGRGVGEPMPKTAAPVALATVVSLALSVALVGCGSSPTASPSASAAGGSPPAASPSANPTVAGIDHPTGATDIVLRIEQGGGFVALDFLATQAPSFTLFGDGKVIFQQRVDVFPEPGPDGVTHNRSWRIAQLDDGQVQELLAFALGPGGLGTAKESYLAGGIADAPDTTFTINAGGVVKKIVVSALGIDPAQSDQAARLAFQALATRLQDFDKGGTIASDVYTPGKYRGVLNQRDPDPSIKPVAWPWPAIKLADFAAASDNGAGSLFMARRTMTAAEVSALGLGDTTGGVQGLVLKGPDGKLYSLILRPMLPDETS
jgi:hypothetical protein